jgi:hypothetical protein
MDPWVVKYASRRSRMGDYRIEHQTLKMDVQIISLFPCPFTPLGPAEVFLNRCIEDDAFGTPAFVVYHLPVGAGCSPLFLEGCR